MDREAEIIKNTVEIIKNYCHPSKIILFGSRAQEKNHCHADFDFAVDIKKPSISMQREIRNAIDKISGLYKVDIVYLLSIDKEFKNIILQTGKVLYERNP